MHGLRQDARGRLLLPARDATGWRGNVQTVDADGLKLFLEGSRKPGLAVPTGPVQSRRPLLIAEGYATAATLHEATGLPALAAFDSGNLLPVAQAWRERFPSRRLVLAGENDHQLPRRDPPLPNIGRDKAAEAAEAVGGRALVPELAPGDDGSDWNDYAARHGRDAVAERVMMAVREAGAERWQDRPLQRVARAR